MARCTYALPNEIMDKISKLAERTDEIIPRVLAAGGKVAFEKVKSNLQSVVGTGTKYESRSTGELAGALGVSGARLDRDGNWNVKVGFAPRRSDGKSNAMIAGVIEYGKSGQPAKPFMKPAKSQSKNAAINAMKDALRREVDGT